MCATVLRFQWRYKLNEVIKSLLLLFCNAYFHLYLRKVIHSFEYTSKASGKINTGDDVGSWLFQCMSVHVHWMNACIMTFHKMSPDYFLALWEIKRVWIFVM